ncbi:ROK family protein [Streptomyces sp. NPDC050315]|uniref:ROK family protein n=1 Tax=Streptomyces sp. NPDC050315 TaxID=3155039 RepID=UPI0034251770
MSRPPGESAVLGLDIGGTAIKSALVAPDGRPLGAVTHHSVQAARRDPEAIVGAVLDRAAGLLEAAVAQGVAVRALGVAACGVIDESAGVAVFSASFGWRDVPLRRLLAERTGLPVVLGHDVRAGGVAEARLGAGRGHEVFLFVPVGTGVGAAVMLGGRPFTGGHWRAGELGHVVVRPGGDRCGCGQRGCVSTLAGGAALVKRYRRLAELDGGAPTDAATVVRLATEGDRVAAGVWAEAVAALAESLALGVTLFDPSAVIVGGGLGRSGDLLFHPLREQLAGRLTFQIMPELLPAALGDEAGCLGAALLAWDSLGERTGVGTPTI